MITDRLSIEAGPQFSFLVDDSGAVFQEISDGASERVEGKKPESFDFAIAGGASLKIAGGLFAQARYTIGLTEISKNAEAKNAVFQLGLGYMF